MTPARRAQAERVELVYYWALQQLGNAMAVDSLELWKRVPATTQAATSAWWLAQVIRLLFGFRREAQDLAIAYYRLVRALHHGKAPTVGGEQPGETTTLEQLRQDFEEIVDHIDAETAADAPWGPSPGGSGRDEDAVVELEQVADIDALIAASDEAALEEAGEVLDNLGVENFLKKLGEIDQAGDDRDLLIEAAHTMAGNRQAAAAMRIMQNAARGLVFDLAGMDPLVEGWVRYSQTGTPCGWCAMLISRGVVYKSQSSALAKKRDGARRVNSDGSVDDHDKYHDNCRCVAVPIFYFEQYDYGDMFALNRELEELWDDLKDEDNEVLKRLYGTTDLLVIFRQLMRKRKDQADTPALAAA